jgi:hypothetical protein
VHTQAVLTIDHCADDVLTTNATLGNLQTATSHSNYNTMYLACTHRCLALAA